MAKPLTRKQVAQGDLAGADVAELDLERIHAADEYLQPRCRDRE